MFQIILVGGWTDRNDTRNPMNIFPYTNDNGSISDGIQNTDKVEFDVTIPYNDLDLNKVSVKVTYSDYSTETKYFDYDNKDNVDVYYSSTSPPTHDGITFEPSSYNWETDQQVHLIFQFTGGTIYQADVKLYNCKEVNEATETFFTGIEEERETEQFLLCQNCPNPFKNCTEIEYTLPRNSQVKVIIYNIAGQRVKTLIDANKKAGTYVVHWDGRDNRGEQVADGVYLYEIGAGDYSDRKKMILLGGVR